jgi:hypothetical protein
MPQIKYFREHAVVWMESRDYRALFWVAVMVTGAWRRHIQSFELNYSDEKSDIQFTLKKNAVSLWTSEMKPTLERRLKTSATLMR